MLASSVQIAQILCLTSITVITNVAKADSAPQRTEEVIAAIECSVKDPGDLKAYLGINKGSTLRIETLSTYVSSVILDRDALITGFPAVLNFNGRTKQFSFSGSSEGSRDGSMVTLNIEGSFALRGEATFIFNLVDREVDAAGFARLHSCKRAE